MIDRILFSCLLEYLKFVTIICYLKLINIMLFKFLHFMYLIFFFHHYIHWNLIKLFEIVHLGNFLILYDKVFSYHLPTLFSGFFIDPEYQTSISWSNFGFHFLFDLDENLNFSIYRLISMVISIFYHQIWNRFFIHYKWILFYCNYLSGMWRIYSLFFLDYLDWVIHHGKQNLYDFD